MALRYVLLGDAYTRILHAVVLLFSFSLIASLLTSCNERPKSISTTTSSSSSSASSSSSTSAATACSIFSNNSNDYLLCQGCVTSTGSTNLTTLATCVHANNGATGGAACVGLTCGSGQTANFATCACVDSAPASSFPGQPGQGDSLTPNLYSGFSIGTKYCDNTGKKGVDCFWDAGGASLNKPLDSTLSPLNVFTDVDYVRWDIALDNSQFPGFISDTNGNDTTNSNFIYTTSTLIGNYSFDYQTKPGTTPVNASNVYMCDCVENYSGYIVGTTNYSSTPGSCLTSLTSATPCTITAGTQNTFTLTTSTAANFTINNVSMNGPSSNQNHKTLGSGLKYTLDATATNVFGIGKSENDTTYTKGIGLFSNIGYYKYSFGPFKVAKTGTTSTILTTDTTKKLSINANLGYSPVSAVESTTFAPDTIADGAVSTRTCSDSSDPCVLTSVYRSTGGSIKYQSFSPKYNNHASSIGTLPTGITAVGTPKIIKDDSQLLVSTNPDKLRVFVRASDGNIYMSKADNGVWGSTWTSLGRPWTAPAYNSNLSWVHQPYTNDFAGTNGWAAVSLTSYHEGISLVGEPSVYYHKTTDGTKSLIAIVTRVSQVANDGSFGAYHNSLFYTVGVATNATTSTSNSFDNLANWSRWMPVPDSGAMGTPIRTQGNPLIVINDKITANTPVLYIFTTKLAGFSMMGGALNAHPPIAPNMTNGTIYNDVRCGKSFGNADCAAGANSFSNGVANWYSYGHQLYYISMSLNAFKAGTYSCGAGDTCANEPSATVATTSITSTAEATAYDGVIVSDWSGLDLNSGSNIRIMANVLRGYSTQNGACSGSSFTGPFTYKTGGAFCGYGTETGADNTINTINITGRYRTFIKWFDFEFPAAGAFAIVSAGADHDEYNLTNSIGTPYAVALDVNRYASLERNDRFVDPNGVTNLMSGIPRMITFTRYSSEKTRTTQPSAQYIASHAAVASAWPDNYMIYRTTDANAYDNISPAGAAFSTYKIGLMYPTSDLMVFNSNGLKNGDVNVPVYILTRDQTGKVALGYWSAKKSQMIGSGITATDLGLFMFYSVGDYTN